VVDKRRIRRSIRQLQHVKTWQLFVLLILSIFVAATFLRLNNIGMIERRTAVIDADNAGNDTATQTRLYDLQRYVSSHMNTNLGKGVPLEATYNRVYNRLLTEASNDNNPNGNIYKKAQEVCAPKFSTYSSAYLQCTVGELAKYPASSNLISSVNLSTSGFVYNFVSPLWSPDFAGLSVLVCIAILTMIIVRLIGVGILKLMLRHHYRSI